MTGLDIAFGFLAGVVSCLTPAALPLFPLTIAAARAAGRAGVIAPAVGLGLSLILTGILVSSFGMLSGFEAIWFRRIICVLLLLQGIALMSASLCERYPVLTGPLRPLTAIILPMFFALSGFLVAGSLERCRTLVGFLSLRVLRLIPALAVEVVLSALLVGPLAGESGERIMP